MTKRRRYYPLLPTKGGKYREPPYCYLSVRTDYEGHLTAGAGITEGVYTPLTTGQQAAEFIQATPRRAWILVYDIRPLSFILAELAARYKEISGIGRETSVIELISADQEPSKFIVDLFPYFGRSILDTAARLNIPLSRYPQTSDDGILAAAAAERVNAIRLIWEFIVKTTKSRFNVSPSRSAGSTGVKTLRPFLPEPIKARGKTISRLTRSAVIGGALHWQPGEYEDAYLYDINAAYPHVMRTLRYPARLQTFINRPPNSDRWIATVKVNYECTGKFSPFAARVPAENITVHPRTVENTRVRLTYLDAMTLSLHGKLEIVQWIEGVCWQPESEVDYFGRWYERLAEAIRNPDEKTVLKIISRSLHSKFNQGQYYEKIQIIRIDDMKELARLQRTKKIAEYIPLPDGLAVKVVSRCRTGFKPYHRPDIEALTLAAARFILYSAVDNFTIYTDTDSIISIRPRPDLPIGIDPGTWKLSEQGAAVIVGPRMYSIGESSKLAGASVTDKIILARALWGAAQGKAQQITATEQAGFFGGREIQYRQHTVTRVVYPQAAIKGNLITVSRSPPVPYTLKPVRRFFSRRRKKRV